MPSAGLGNGFAGASGNPLARAPAAVLDDADSWDCAVVDVSIAMDVFRSLSAPGCARSFRCRYHPLPALRSINGGTGSPRSYPWRRVLGADGTARFRLAACVVGL